MHVFHARCRPTGIVLAMTAFYWRKLLHPKGKVWSTGCSQGLVPRWCAGVRWCVELSTFSNDGRIEAFTPKQAM